MKKIYLLIILNIGVCSFLFSKENMHNDFYCNELIDSINIPKLTIINGSIGVITTSPNYKFGSKIGVFNFNGALIDFIKITDEYDVLALKCHEINELYYKVRLNNGVIGYLKRNNKLIIFQTWEKHVISLFAVGFDYKNNPLQIKPTINSIKLAYNKDEFYMPFKIKGEWLQLKWGYENNWKYAWIRWRNQSKLLIEFFYFA